MMGHKKSKTEMFPDLPGPLPDESVLIFGAGRFGRRAAGILSRHSEAPIFLVEKDGGRLSGIEMPSIGKIPSEAIDFLVHNFHLFGPSITIIPAVPLHLASSWLVRYLERSHRITQIEVPEGLFPSLPHAWPAGEGSLLVSYADFKCPEDCAEPIGRCTVEGEVERIPLYALLSGLHVRHYFHHVVRSRQLAPGVGGYRIGDLKRLAGKVREAGTGKWLVGTACRCHGIMTACEISAL